MADTNGDTAALDAPSIVVKNLTYKFQDGSEGLKDVNLELPAGSRTLLIGGTPRAFFYSVLFECLCHHALLLVHAIYECKCRTLST